ncbi:chitin binding protein [Listeria floridensis FSL S10-1187]|uniref:Chitin binding protein n=1 Tax=Listeria floridensis FSL S10-1187 TaxID=1265817 RepID=A0ABN0RDQ8_9LIST|nr:chitin binding protein [Listeria floridensis FSL S10-1187]
MKKKVITGLAMATFLGGGILLGDQVVSAHGYVESPASRGYQGSLDKNSIGWTEALTKYGNVITNPQSLEAPKGFPNAGPADGRIASANGGLGQIGDFVLDQAGADRWVKSEVNAGLNTFTWHFTAPHKTTKFHYYITKQGWNPNSPLKRSDLERIGEVYMGGKKSK